MARRRTGSGGHARFDWTEMSSSRIRFGNPAAIPIAIMILKRPLRSGSLALPSGSARAAGASSSTKPGNRQTLPPSARIGRHASWSSPKARKQSRCAANNLQKTSGPSPTSACCGAIHEYQFGSQKLQRQLLTAFCLAHWRASTPAGFICCTPCPGLSCAPRLFARAQCSPYKQPAAGFSHLA